MVENAPTTIPKAYLVSILTLLTLNGEVDRIVMKLSFLQIVENSIYTWCDIELPKDDFSNLVGCI